MNEYDIIARHTNDGHAERIHIADGKITSAEEIAEEQTLNVTEDITASILAAYDRTLTTITSLAPNGVAEGVEITEDKVLSDLWAHGDESPAGFIETMVIIEANNSKDDRTDHYPSYGIYDPGHGWMDETGSPFRGDEKIFAWMRRRFPAWIETVLRY